MWVFPITVLIVGLDVATKQAALCWLAEGISVPVIRNIFHLTLVQNRGIAFGVLAQYSDWLLFLIALSVVVLVYYAFRLRASALAKQIAYAFILGGAVGNLIDRFRFGHVIDFLDFRIWPVFNLADSFITMGVCFFIFVTLRRKSRAS